MSGPTVLMEQDATRSQLAAALVRMARGDRDALRLVYRDTSAKLFGVCLRILCEKEEAADVLQDVYLTVWRRAGMFDPDRASPITWLVAIARNRSIDRLRARATVRRMQPSRWIMRDLLTSADYEVTEVENGEEALAAVAKQRPDLILMDIQLPIMDGYEATRRIKADPLLSSIPIIAVTSYALGGYEEKARAAGCNDFVSKPYSPRQLLAKIREFLP